MKLMNLNKQMNVRSLFFTGVLLAAVGVGSAADAHAQSKKRRSSLSTVAAEQKQTGVTTFYYSSKSNATGKYHAEIRRGKSARLYYDNSRKQWAVDVENNLKPNTTTTTAANTDLSADGGKLPNGASIIYFPTKASAEGIYKSSLAQGDWAKMWYDEKRKEWAVAVLPGGGKPTNARTTTQRSGTTTRSQTTTTRSKTTAATSADGGSLPNGASIIYFPTKESAEGVYKSSLKQGDWAKMWYDQKCKEWAVAVKPR